MLNTANAGARQLCSLVLFSWGRLYWAAAAGRRPATPAHWSNWGIKEPFACSSILHLLCFLKMFSMALRQRGRNDEAGVSLGWGWIANQTEQCLPRGPGPRGAAKDSQQLFEIGTTEEQFNSDRSHFHFVSSVSNNKHRENITIAVNSSGSILKARHEKVVLG